MATKNRAHEEEHRRDTNRQVNDEEHQRALEWLYAVEEQLHRRLGSARLLVGNSPDGTPIGFVLRRLQQMGGTEMLCQGEIQALSALRTLQLLDDRERVKSAEFTRALNLARQERHRRSTEESTKACTDASARKVAAPSKITPSQCDLDQAAQWLGCVEELLHRRLWNARSLIRAGSDGTPVIEVLQKLAAMGAPSRICHSEEEVVASLQTLELIDDHNRVKNSEFCRALNQARHRRIRCGSTEGNQGPRSSSAAHTPAGMNGVTSPRHALPSWRFSGKGSEQNDHSQACEDHCSNAEVKVHAPATGDISDGRPVDVCRVPQVPTVQNSFSAGQQHENAAPSLDGAHRKLANDVGTDLGVPVLPGQQHENTGPSLDGAHRKLASNFSTESHGGSIVVAGDALTLRAGNTVYEMECGNDEKPEEDGECKMAGATSDLDESDCTLDWPQQDIDQLEEAEPDAAARAQPDAAARAEPDAAARVVPIARVTSPQRPQDHFIAHIEDAVDRAATQAPVVPLEEPAVCATTQSMIVNGIQTLIDSAKKAALSHPVEPIRVGERVFAHFLDEECEGWYEADVVEVNNDNTFLISWCDKETVGADEDRVKQIHQIKKTCPKSEDEEVEKRSEDEEVQLAKDLAKVCTHQEALHTMTPACVELFVPSPTDPQLEAALPSAIMSVTGVSDRDVRLVKGPEGLRCKIHIFDGSSVLAVSDAIQKALRNRDDRGMLYSVAHDYICRLTVRVRWPMERLQTEIKRLYPAYDLTLQQFEGLTDALALSRGAYHGEWERTMARAPVGLHTLCQQPSMALYDGNLMTIEEAYWRGLQEDSLIQDAVRLTDVMVDAAAAQKLMKATLAPDTDWANTDFDNVNKVLLGDSRRFLSLRSTGLLPRAKLYDPGIESRGSVLEHAKHLQKLYDYKAPVRSRLDVSRISITFQMVGDLLAGLKRIMEAFDVAWVTNRFRNPSCHGYRDLRIGVRQRVEVPDAPGATRVHYSELRLHLQDMCTVQVNVGPDLKLPPMEMVQSALAGCGIAPHDLDGVLRVAMSVLDCTAGEAMRNLVKELQHALQFTKDQECDSYIVSTLIEKLGMLAIAAGSSKAFVRKLTGDQNEIGRREATSLSHAFVDTKHQYERGTMSSRLSQKPLIPPRPLTPRTPPSVRPLTPRRPAFRPSGVSGPAKFARALDPKLSAEINVDPKLIARAMDLQNRRRPVRPSSAPPKRHVTPGAPSAASYCDANNIDMPYEDPFDVVEDACQSGSFDVGRDLGPDHISYCLDASITVGQRPHSECQTMGPGDARSSSAPRTPRTTRPSSAGTARSASAGRMPTDEGQRQGPLIPKRPSSARTARSASPARTLAPERCPPSPAAASKSQTLIAWAPGMLALVSNVKSEDGSGPVIEDCCVEVLHVDEDCGFASCLVPGVGEVLLRLCDLSSAPYFVAEHRAFLSFCWRRFGCPLRAWHYLLGADSDRQLVGTSAASSCWKIFRSQCLPSAFVQRCSEVGYGGKAARLWDLFSKSKGYVTYGDVDPLGALDVQRFLEWSAAKPERKKLLNQALGSGTRTEEVLALVLGLSAERCRNLAFGLCSHQAAPAAPPVRKRSNSCPRAAADARRKRQLERQCYLGGGHFLRGQRSRCGQPVRTPEKSGTRCTEVGESKVVITNHGRLEDPKKEEMDRERRKSFITNA